MDPLRPVVKAVFTGPLRPPVLRLRFPRIVVPSSMTLFAISLFSYFLVTSGVIYDVINEPPSVGSALDPATGQYKPQAIVPYRINGQYIFEGLSAGFLYVLASYGFLQLYSAVDKTAPPSTGDSKLTRVITGAVLVTVAFNVLIVYLKIKLPGYMIFAE